MNNDLIWQQNSLQSDNRDNLNAIAQWWSSLAGQEITWQQRLIPDSKDLQDIDWQPQKFDEHLVLDSAQIRGITLFWHSPKALTERNLTPNKLQLNLPNQTLYIFPQSQSQVLVKVSLPKIIYHKLNLSNPHLAATIKDGQGIILLRDEIKKLEITVTLNQPQIAQLLESLQIKDNHSMSNEQ
ncbi:MAG: hypothetical protein AAF383_07460 [Cyanobacteria bacterium P01_A01_bin.83]